MRITVLNSGLPACPPGPYRRLSAVQARILRNFSHSTCSRDEAERTLAHEIRVAGFQRHRNISNLPFLGVGIIRRIETASSCASQCLRQRSSPLDIVLLCTFVTSAQQDHDFRRATFTRSAGSCRRRM